MFFQTPTDIDTVGSAAHLIQVALTPVFMLSGIGTLINAFNTRLARVSDHLEAIHKQLAAPISDEDGETGKADRKRLEAHSFHLQRRIFVLDAAILLNGTGGAATCGAAMALFVGSLRDSSTSSWMLALFGLALMCTVGALSFFLADTFLSWHGLKRRGALPPLP
ncbi:DUF2721 domain-containing protein [Neokomagataea tanensis]|uniref:DUF2721 domain-containing protein n=1 Tax=Neokomagataea tanensis TaxID=661191 RepID=A0A4Y6V723_9PROT|nr:MULTISPECIES: DUF2721 domain-containing protein [Neokomagataea]QDH25862.1 DUF2721 domain-containing protein [Neokomagataea tanensis]